MTNDELDDVRRIVLAFEDAATWCQELAERAMRLILSIQQHRHLSDTELSEQLGTPVSMNEIASPIWKARTFDAYGIDYPRTEKGNPSFKAGKLGWMAKHQHWLPRLIATGMSSLGVHFSKATFCNI